MNFIQEIKKAIAAHEPLPALSGSSFETMTLQQAYGLQAEVYDALSTLPPAGIKAGITNPQMQKMFNIDHALLGRLYPSGKLTNGDSFAHVPGKLIECEIGVIVDASGGPVGICPALEFAFAAFKAPLDASAAYLTAANVAADQFMPGERYPWQSSYADIEVILYHNGEQVNRSPITASLGGPGAAAAWIIKEAAARGLPVGNDCLLMTGACGKVIPAEPGEYLADYGPLGQLTFTVTEADDPGV